ncbi:MAG: hypothetical protein LBG27_14605 [Spirochaetaceae bacterium]|jgi:hypothetical protein|nr:hypothetical protein [Spirochaetaceae bacterium]
MAREKSFDMVEESGNLDFHSIRLENRFVRTMETLIQQPDKSIRKAGENRAGTKAVCRMPGNEDFDWEATVRRMSGYGGTILAVQDTTGTNCDTRLKTEGTGHTGDKTLGVNIHSRLAVTADGLVVGLLNQANGNRPEPKDDSGSRESKKVRPTEEKERFRRLETLEQSARDMPEGIRVITVRDREGDKYELFAEAPAVQEPFLIRAVQNRMTVKNRRIPDETQKKRCQGRVFPGTAGAVFPDGRRHYGRAAPPLR